MRVACSWFCVAFVSSSHTSAEHALAATCTHSGTSISFTHLTSLSFYLCMFLSLALCLTNIPPTTDPLSFSLHLSIIDTRSSIQDLQLYSVATHTDSSLSLSLSCLHVAGNHRAEGSLQIALQVVLQVVHMLANECNVTVLVVPECDYIHRGRIIWHFQGKFVG